MAENRPAWQTDDLLEEWIEPPPPQDDLSSLRTPEPVKQSTVNGSIRWPGTARKASLRSEAIGGPVRQVSGQAGTGRPPMRIVSGNVQNSIGSLLAPSPAPHPHPDRSLHSPPASLKSASSQEEEQQGTFLIRPVPITTGSLSGSQKPLQSAGIGIGKPKQLRNPFVGGGGGFGGAGGAGGIFEKTKLERMFEPPTPPAGGNPASENERVAEDAETINIVERVTTTSTTTTITLPAHHHTTPAVPPPSDSPSPAPNTPTAELRRTSHSYVPRRPSRLSQSVSPKELACDSTGEGSSVAETTMDGGVPAPGNETELPVEQDEEDELESSREEDEVSEGMEEERYDDFESPEHTEDELERSEQGENDEQDEGVDLSPAQRFSQKVRNASFTFSPPTSLPRTKAQLAAAQQADKPKLKLFQKYDTYTKDHLSKIVEVISQRGTPIMAARRARGRSSVGSSIGGGARSRFSEGSQGRDEGASGSQEGGSQFQSGSGSPSGSGEASGSGGSSSWGEEERRASKRIRLSASYSPEPQDRGSHSGSSGRASSGAPSYYHRSRLSESPSLSLRPRKTHLALGVGQGMPSVQQLERVTSAAKDENRRSWGDKGQDMLRRIRERVGAGVGMDMSMSGAESLSGTGGSGTNASDSPTSNSSSSFSSGPSPVMPLAPTHGQPNGHPVPPIAQRLAPNQAGPLPTSTTYSTLRSESTGAGNGSGSGSGGTITSQYLETGRGMLDRIKERTVSDSSGSGHGGDKGKGKAVDEKGSAPRIAVQGQNGRPSLLEQRRIRGLPSHSGSTTTTSSATVRPQGTVAPSNLPPADRIAPGYLLASSRAPTVPDDLNRYVSSASTATAGTTTTAVSTSFVKHRGSTAPSSLTSGHETRRGKEFIPLESVQEGLSDRVGQMRFDRVAMKWVKVGEGLPVEGEEEEEDIFKGLDSLREEPEEEEDAAVEEDDSAVDTSLAGVIRNDLESTREPDDDEESLEGDRTEIQDTDGAESRSEKDDSENSFDDDTIRQDTEGATTHAETGSLSVIPSTSIDAGQTPSPPSEGSPERSNQHPPIRPELHATQSAPTPLQRSKGGEELRRSILRNNVAPGSVLKKKSDPLTPIQDSPLNSSRRSVSFSDGRKAGPILDPQVKSTKIRRMGPLDVGSDSREERDLFEATREEDGDFGTRRALLQSARSGRIAEMALGLDDEESDVDSEPSATPSKPSQGRHSKTLSLSDNDTLEGNSTIKASGSHRLNRSIGYARGNIDDTRLTDWPFEVAHDHLVELITEVQPFEPHWEILTRIDLSGKGAVSVARLKEFLPMLDEAVLNNNQISFLSGIPNTIRSLHVSRNKLSSLTSLAHLCNLQYLDISRNELDSVSQLSCLKHLRELNVNHNKITDLSEILEMDCLQKLTCIDNSITSVDFSQSKWSRMETLNLSRNRIASVTGLEFLTGLTSLNLDSNRLTELSVPTAMMHLRVLRFSHNSVRELNVSHFPRLRTLYADNNSLSELQRSRYASGSKLEYLSLRNQRVRALLLTHDDLKDIRHLYISGNPLPDDFFPRKPMFSMVYLEAAACKLSQWPEAFVSRLPNLRILNLNYNFIENLDGLQGLTGLRKLMMVGGRLGGNGTKGVVRGLRGLRTIEEVDLRMNPCTLNFYLPLMLPGGSASSALDPSTAPASDVAQLNPTPSDAWVQLDSNFRRSLPDEWYSKRLVYRGLVMMACEGVIAIDGIRLTEGEKKKTMKLVDHMLDNDLL